MATYLLVHGDRIVNTIETTAPDLTALPLLRGDAVMSLVNAKHVTNLQLSKSPTEQKALEALGLTDERAPLPNGELAWTP